MLQAAAISPLAALAACSTNEGVTVTSSDDVVRQAVADSEQGLLGRYDATIAAYPALAEKLRPLRDQHAEHLAAVGSTTRDGDQQAASVAKTSAAAVQALTAAERTAATERTVACGQATSADLIWILALIATSEAQHAAVLSKGSA